MMTSSRRVFVLGIFPMQQEIFLGQRCTLLCLEGTRSPCWSARLLLDVGQESAKEEGQAKCFFSLPLFFRLHCIVFSSASLNLSSMLFYSVLHLLHLSTFPFSSFSSILLSSPLFSSCSYLIDLSVCVPVACKLRSRRILQRFQVSLLRFFLATFARKNNAMVRRRRKRQQRKCIT